MHIKSLVLEDFGPHEGEHAYYFPERGVIGIVGSNGNGKSHIMDAIRILLVDRFDKPLCYVVHGYGLKMRDENPIMAARVTGVFDLGGRELVISKTYKLDKVADDIHEKMAEAVKFAEVKTSAKLRYGDESTTGSKKVSDRVLELLGAPAAVLDDTIFVRQKKTNAVFTMLASERKDALYKLSGAVRMTQAGEIAAALQRNLSTLDRSAELESAICRLNQLSSELTVLRQIPEVDSMDVETARTELLAMERTKSDEDALARRRADQLAARESSATAMNTLSEQYQGLMQRQQALPNPDPAKIKELADRLVSVEAADKLYRQRKAVQDQFDAARGPVIALQAELEKLPAVDPARIEYLLGYLASVDTAAQAHQRYLQTVSEAEAAERAIAEFTAIKNPTPPEPPKADQSRIDAGRDKLSRLKSEREAAIRFRESLERSGECDQCHARAADVEESKREADQRIAAAESEIAKVEPALRQCVEKLKEYQTALTAYERSLAANVEKLASLKSAAESARARVQSFNPVPQPVDQASQAAAAAELQSLKSVRDLRAAKEDSLRLAAATVEMLDKQLKAMPTANPVDQAALQAANSELAVLNSQKQAYDALAAEIRDVTVAYNVRKAAFEEVQKEPLAMLPAHPVTNEMLDFRKLAYSKLESERAAFERAAGEIKAKEELYRLTSDDVARLTSFQDQQKIAQMKASFLGDVCLLCRRDGFPAALSSGYTRDLNIKMAHVGSAMGAPFTLSLSSSFEFVADRGGVKEPYFQLSGGQETLAAWIWHLGRYEKHSGHLKLMCMDEPTDGLDKENMDKVAEQLTQLGAYCAATGLQTLVITHEASLMRGFTRTITV